MILKPSTVGNALKSAIKAKRPTFLWGPPGIGKSQKVREVAEDLGMELRDVRATLLDPVDLRGLPKVEKGRTIWSPPNFLPSEGKGILFLDELNAAPQSVQTACYQLILDRRLGEYELPEGWIVFAAGNRLADSAAAGRMSTALANRFVHLEMHADLDDWINWAMHAGVQPELIGFLKFRPELLHKHSKDQHAFPSPRSWDFCGQILKTEPTREVEMALIEGAVGQGAATEFYAFLDLWRKVPDIDNIIKEPNKHKDPGDPATRYAVAYAIAAKMTKQNATNCILFLDKMPLEYALVAIKAATQRDSDICSTQSFVDWVGKHGVVFS